MFFTSAIVAQSHYQGKTHAKRVRLVLGEPPNLPTAVTSPTNTGISHTPAAVNLAALELLSFPNWVLGKQRE